MSLTPRRQDAKAEFSAEILVDRVAPVYGNDSLGPELVNK